MDLWVCHPDSKVGTICWWSRLLCVKPTNPLNRICWGRWMALSPPSWKTFQADFVIQAQDITSQLLWTGNCWTQYWLFNLLLLTSGYPPKFPAFTPYLSLHLPVGTVLEIAPKRKGLHWGTMQNKALWLPSEHRRQRRWQEDSQEKPLPISKKRKGG